ncbi:GNAT family N-acetyltransferase [Actinoplanes sp. NPDC020271]|uniref:GNAT family N-acetyltransferase n=1 Tax=Actinoplanes sp. NPDC020271 TaxID=3363896 RepID=UPI0037A39ABB
MTVVRVGVGEAGFRGLVGLFDEYRVHYGEAAEPARTAEWLSVQLRGDRLRAWVTEQDGRAAGFLTAAVMPASLRLGEFWAVRDVFVRPECRRSGAARALLDQVVAEARAAGAIRISLQTEPANTPALALYRSLGFRPVEGLIGLGLPVTDQP